MEFFKKNHLIEQGWCKKIGVIGFPAGFLKKSLKIENKVSEGSPGSINLNIGDIQKYNSDFWGFDCQVAMWRVDGKFLIGLCVNCASKEILERLYFNIDIQSFYVGNLKLRHLNAVAFDIPIVYSDIIEMMDLTQQEIGDLIGKSKQLVSDVKNGRSQPTIEHISILHRAFPHLPWAQFHKHYSV